MRIITKRRLLEAVEKHPAAKAKIFYWHAVTRGAVWKNLVETRQSFPHADQVKVGGGNTVTIFNLSNDYRLSTAIHYDRQKIFILRFLTHAEYDKENWKTKL